jgi:peroxiredoxin
MHLKPILFFTGVAAVVAYIFLADVGSTALVRAGSLAPTFTVKNLEGENVSLDDLKGRVVFLNFWSTDCPPVLRKCPTWNCSLKDLRGENSR